MTVKLRAGASRATNPPNALDSPEAVAEYLTVVLAGDDPSHLVLALGEVARARGMTQIAKDSGIAREALYKALRADAQPRFDTVARVCRALGVRLVAAPAAALAPAKSRPRKRTAPRVTAAR